MTRMEETKKLLNDMITNYGLIHGENYLDGPDRFPVPIEDVSFWLAAKYPSEDWGYGPDDDVMDFYGRMVNGTDHVQEAYVTAVVERYFNDKPAN